MTCLERVREPHIVMHLDLKRFEQWVGEWGMGVVEVAEVGSINRGTRKQGGWQRRKRLGWVLEDGCVGMAALAHEISTTTSGFDDFVRTTLAIR